MIFAIPLLLGSVLAGGATAPVSKTASDSCSFSGARDKLARARVRFRLGGASLGGATVKVCYGRPSARGRTIMGGVVPFDAPWRLGANEAATLQVPVAVRFGTVSLKPGIYSLYAIPGRKTWQIVVNDSAARWGIPINAPVRKHDVGAVTVTPEATDAFVETMTIRLDPAPDGTLTFVFEWEKTRARVTIARTT
jgi:hypothetical protein